MSIYDTLNTGTERRLSVQLRRNAAVAVIRVYPTRSSFAGNRELQKAF